MSDISMSDITEILIAREPQNSRRPKNSIERFDDIKARLDKTNVWTQDREDIDWLCHEVEWLRTAYVVHCRKVVEANPVRTFQDEMLIAKIRAQRDEARANGRRLREMIAQKEFCGDATLDGDPACPECGRAPGHDHQEDCDWGAIAAARRAAEERAQQAADLKTFSQNLNGEQANA